ncbi:hypothetical protein BMI86_10280 [Thioclava sp. DLFJ5-1]|uniref:hypothetical protein n=1 Tax=Thioclava sp. DLFJ5-1 TaxID=1915314 RepID=UPI00099809C8|nr:hypothetical protein [Thioclava sp. DLFJ5-1]OOY20884.1 hypothetical protein BMI86_10280 [Thioclava sp. DLFJ5-1]
MKIECLQHRKGGSVITVGGKPYKFKPLNDEFGAPHVGEVGNADHAKALLAIKEGFREYLEENDEPAQEPAKEPMQEPAKEPDAPATDATEPATDPDATEAGEGGPLPALDELSDDELSKAYQELFNQKPHGRASRDTIIQKIEEEEARLEAEAEANAAAQTDTKEA